jgi:hypothetical protein
MGTRVILIDPNTDDRREWLCWLISAPPAGSAARNLWT